MSKRPLLLLHELGVGIGHAVGSKIPALLLVFLGPHVTEDEPLLPVVLIGPSLGPLLLAPIVEHEPVSGWTRFRMIWRCGCAVSVWQMRSVWCSCQPMAWRKLSAAPSISSRVGTLAGRPGEADGLHRVVALAAALVVAAEALQVRSSLGGVPHLVDGQLRIVVHQIARGGPGHAFRRGGMLVEGIALVVEVISASPAEGASVPVDLRHHREADHRS